MSEAEFMKRINCRPATAQSKLYDDDGNLLYEGYLLNDRPYGLGTVYFANGNKYQEGVFDFKGLVQGREYYPSGQLRFEGTFVMNTAYGPNFPRLGSLYDEDGRLVFSGKFEVKRGGVGYPMMKYPRFSPCSDRPEIKYFRDDDF